MKAIRKKRLTTVLFLLLTSGLGTILIIKALDSNLDFFFTPSEIFAGDLPENKELKLVEWFSRILLKEMEPI